MISCSRDWRVGGALPWSISSRWLMHSDSTVPSERLTTRRRSRLLLARAATFAASNGLGGPWRVSASLYDASRREPLYQATASVPNNISGAASAYARLADSLLLRGAGADSVAATARGLRSLPAVQAFSRAQLALDDWDLVSADSLFQAASLFDPDYARARLWLAQVRAWQGQNRNAWGTVAERALAMSEQLSDRERRLSRALVHLGRGSYANACAEYAALARRNDRDFSAWFGLGQCQAMNNIVESDRSSPSVALSHERGPRDALVCESFRDPSIRTSRL